MTNYLGAFHVHSTYSDGTANIKEIAKAANEVGLRWVVVTDHNTLKGKREEGWYDNVAVIIEQEISPDTENHYLALNLNKEINHLQKPKDFINEVKTLGGYGFIAHPDESTTRKFTTKHLRWSDWTLKGFNGIEIWNHLSDCADNHNPKKFLIEYFFKNHILTGPTDNVLKWWDSLNNEQEEIISAVGGLDTHCLTFKKFGIKFQFFPYKDSFKTIQNQLHLNKELSTSFDEAKTQIITALKNGQNTVINSHWSNNKNLPAFCIQTQNKNALPGYKIENTNNSKALVTLNKKASVKIMKNGSLYKNFTGKKLILENLPSGKYRLEAYLNNKPWIFTNPIHLI